MERAEVEGMVGEKEEGKEGAREGGRAETEEGKEQGGSHLYVAC